MLPLHRPRVLARGAVTLSFALAATSFVTACAVRSNSQPSQKEEAPVGPANGGTGESHKGAEGMMGAPAATAPIAFDSESDKSAKKLKSGMTPAPSIGALPGANPLAPAAPPKASKPLDQAPAPLPVLDPNARYATTYRPGGAALAAFDAALSKGAIPAANKDLVGDFGAQYAAPLTTPSKAGMAFKVDLERTALGPKGGPLHLRISMKGSDVAPLRAPLSVHVVLDVSGSMMGVPIDNAKKAAEALVARLDAQDHFSMVTFSDSAKVIVPSGAIGPRRAQVLAKIQEVVAGGGTNVSSGLDLGYQQAMATGGPDSAVKIVMVLSDGHANGGDTDPKSLAKRSARAFQEGVQTSTFGIGTDFDASLLASIADQGAGAYYYLADSNQIAPALAKELDARLQPVAQALEIRVRLRPGVFATKVYGSHVLDGDAAAIVRAQELAVDAQVKKKDGIAENRKEDAAGGMRFFVPAFAKGDRHAMLLSLLAPAGASEKTIASVEIRYKDRILKQNVTQEIPVKVSYAVNDEASGKTLDLGVQTTVQAFAAGDTIWRAAELVELGDRSTALALIKERSTLLRKAKIALSEPRLEADAARLDRLADAVFGPSQLQDSIVLAVLLRGAGSGYLR